MGSMWQQDPNYAVRNRLLSQKNLSHIATTAEFRERRVDIQGSRDKDGFQRMQKLNFIKVTGELKHELQMAYQKMNELGLESLEKHSDSVGKLTSSSLEVETLLAERRDLRLKVNVASTILVSTRGKLQNLYSLLLSRRSIMNLKIARVRALIMVESSPTDAESEPDEDEVDATNSSCMSKFIDFDRGKETSHSRSSVPAFDEELGSSDGAAVSSCKKDVIKASDDSISKSLDDVFLSLNIKLKELENCMTSNTVEIKMLHSIVISSNDHIARQRHEILSLKSQLKSSRM
jgi:hypothetical protein